MGLLLHWLGLLAFWLLLSGIYDAKHIGLGIVLTAAIALLARRMQLVNLEGEGGAAHHLARPHWLRVLLYSVWLFRQVAVANWEVARIVLDPRLPIDPALVLVPVRVTSDLGIMLLANSITVTPGTITVRAAEDGNDFLVHCLVDKEEVVAGIHAMERGVIAALPTFEGAREAAA